MANAIQITQDKPSYNIGDLITLTVVDPSAAIQRKATWLNEFGGSSALQLLLFGGGQLEDDANAIKWSVKSSTWSTDAVPVLTAIVTGTAA